MKNSLDKEKIAARERLNSLPPKEAQELVNRVLGTDDLQPDLSSEVDWNEIPLPCDLSTKNGS